MLRIIDVYIDKREEAADEAVLTRLKADIVIFTGDQLRLTSILGGTAFQDILLDKYQNEEFVCWNICWCNYLIYIKEAVQRHY
jgi:cyanophycinase-like exopeptidase